MSLIPESFANNSEFKTYKSMVGETYRSAIDLLKYAKSDDFQDKSETNAVIERWNLLMKKTADFFKDFKKSYESDRPKGATLSYVDYFLVREYKCWLAVEGEIKRFARHYFKLIELKCILKKDIVIFKKENEALETELKVIEKQYKNEARTQKLEFSNYMTASPIAASNRLLGDLIKEIDILIVEESNKTLLTEAILKQIN